MLNDLLSIPGKIFSSVVVIQAIILSQVEGSEYTMSLIYPDKK